MKLRLLSDLHFEGGIHRELFTSQGEDVLILAGDIHTGANNVWTTLKQFAEHQPNIVYVMGNHEFYRQDYHDTCRKLEELARHSSIHILNPGVVYYNGKLSSTPTLGSVKIIGAPLWTNFRNNDLSKMHATLGINDFRLIEFDNHYFTPNDAASLFDQQYAFLKANEDADLFITHFLPCVECIDPMYLTKANDNLNPYFANDLSSWVSTLKATWLFGHTHSNVDVMVGDCHLVANPYGYGYNKHFKEQLINI